MKVVAYCRVSSNDKDQKNSFNNQREHYLDKFQNDPNLTPAACGMLCRSNGNEIIPNIDGIFADEGISGTKLKNRHAFQEMLECAKNKMFDKIYVKSISRFSRSIEDITSILKTLKGYGVGVIFEDFNVDSLEAKNELVINMLASAVQEESRNKSDNVKFGLTQLRLKGGWVSNAPYGYDKKDGFLYINETEAEVVKTIFRLYLDEGKGYNHIARYLNDRGHKTKKGSIWTMWQVWNVVRNEMYTGVQKSNKTTSTDINRVDSPKDGLVYTKEIDPIDWIVVERPEIKIIEKDYFQRVQAEIEKRTAINQEHGAKSTKHSFSGLLICGHCKGTYKRKPRGASKEARQKLGYFWCCGHNDNYGKSICGHRYMLVESELLEAVKMKISELRQADLSGILQSYIDLYLKHDPTQLERIESELEENRKYISTLIRLHAIGELEEREFNGYHKDAKTTKSHLDRERDIIINYQTKIDFAKKQFEEYQHTLKSIDLDNLTNVELRRVFKRIIVRKGFHRIIGKKKDKSRILSMEFDFNFLGVDINKLIKDIDNSDRDQKEKNALFNKLRYCEFETIPFEKRGKRFVMILDEEDPNI